ncbi:MAG: hypothetical protein RI897_508 [Verrucomicrobiota bacterium]|jgi:hypothetical protein
MKTITCSLLLLLTTLSASAQGTINFNNRVTVAGIDAPITFGGVGLRGPDFLGQLFVLDPGSDSYEPVGGPTPFQSHPLLAGYINGGNTIVPFIAPGNDATVVLRAWNAAAGSIWSEVLGRPNGIYGQTAPITITLGGAGSPPSLPANLVGLNGAFMIPEPTTFALIVLGLGMLRLKQRDRTKRQSITSQVQ